jgi:hypothetical protein
MSTTMTLHLSQAFLDDVLGTGGPTTQDGVWAYIYNPDAPSDQPQFTTLIEQGALGSGLVSDGSGNYTVTVSLTDSTTPKVNGGTLFLLLQSETPNTDPSLGPTHHDLTTLIPDNGGVGAVQPNVLNWNYGFSQFEFSLLNQGGDQADLTGISGFSLNMGVNIDYTGGPTSSASRGYKPTQAEFTSTLTGLQPQAAFTYPTAPAGDTPFSALDGQTSIVVSPSNGNFGAQYYYASNWSRYLGALGQLEDISLSGTTNGEPDANGIWHNSQYYSYTLKAVTLGNGAWGAAGDYFLFSPTALSQTKGYMLISAASLQQNLYAAGQGQVTLWQDAGLTQPYDIPGASSPPGTPPIKNFFNPSTNNEWGNVFTNLFTGFTGGYWGTIANQANARNDGSNLAPAQIDLDISTNWEPTYAFDAYRANAVPSYQHNDAYSYQFYTDSNVYGSAFSDNLMLGLSPSPLISVWDPGANSGQGGNVANIDLYVFGQDETNPYYTQPVGASFLPVAAGDDYLVPAQPGSTSVTVNAQGAGIVVRPDATLQLGIYLGDGKFDYVTVATGGNLWQTFTVTGGPGSWSVTPGGSQSPGVFGISNLPTLSSAAAGQVNWYQLVFSDGAGDQKVYSFYTTASGTAGQIETTPASLAADGGATFPPVNAATPTALQLSLNPQTSMPEGLLSQVYNSQFQAQPGAPVAGTLAGGEFSPVAGQVGTGLKASLDGQIPAQPTPSISLGGAALPALAFGWTGTNTTAAAGGGTPVQPTVPASGPYVPGLISEYTNKINAGNIAQISVTGTLSAALGSKPFAMVLQTVADLDGQWQTPAALTLANGTYSVTMTEYLADGVTAFSPSSIPLAITVDTSLTPGAAVSGTAAQVAASLDTYGDNPPVSITITDNAPLTVSVEQLLTDAGALAVTVNANGTALSLAVSDTAASISAALGTLANTSSIGSIAISDGKPLTVTVAASGGLVGALSGTLGSYSLAVVDSPEQIAAGLSALDDDSHVVSITVAGSGAAPVVAPTISVTYAQFQAETTALAHLTGTYSLRVTGVTGKEYDSFQYDFRDGSLTGTRYFDVALDGLPYTIAEEDFDPAGNLTRVLYDAFDASLPYNSFEANLSDGAVSSWTITYQNPESASSAFTEVDLDWQGLPTRYAYSGVVSSYAYSSYQLHRSGTAGNGWDGRYFFENIQNQAYTSYEQDLNVFGNTTRLVYSGFGRGINPPPAGQTQPTYYETPYATLTQEIVHTAGGDSVAGTTYFYSDVVGQAYSSYAYTYDSGNNLTGAQYFFTGVEGEAYSSYEQDFDGTNTFLGSKYFYTDVQGQPYSSYEVDLDADGMQTGSKWFYTGVTGQAFSSYQQILDGQSNLALEIFDNDDGTHTLVGYQDGQTIESVHNDTITGGGTGVTFAFGANFGQAVLQDFASQSATDMIQLPALEFADFSAFLSATVQSAGDTLTTAANGDSLTIKNMTTGTLQGLSGQFSFV